MNECENCYWLDNDTCGYVDGYRPDIDGDCSNLLEKEFAQEIKENVISDCIDECIRIIEGTVWKDADMLVEMIKELKRGGRRVSK